MKQVMYNKSGDQIVAPSDRIAYLESKGWSVEPPKAKRKAKTDEETE